MEEQHSESSVQLVQYFNCEYCLFSTPEKAAFDYHTSTSHREANRLDEPENNASVSSNVQHWQPSSSHHKELYDTRRKYLEQREPHYTITRDKIITCPYPDCNFSGLNNYKMKEHISVHKASNEIVTYRCRECSYESKRKSDLTRHLLIHSTGVTMYQCPECPYATKRKNDMPRHVLCHKSPQEVPVFNCPKCCYRTKRKSDLKRHVNAHDSSIEFPCTECNYVSKRKNDLNKHMLVHCDKRVVGVFKCRKCEFSTMKISKFARHVLTNCTFDDCKERNDKILEELFTREHIKEESSSEEVDLLVEDVTRILHGNESSKVIVLSKFYEPDEMRG